MNNIRAAILLGLVEDDEERAEFTLERRRVRDGSNPFSMPERAFKEIYRLSRELVQDLMNEVLPQMDVEGTSTRAIPNDLKIFVALHFLAHGSYQKGVGHDFFIPMSQSSVSRSLHSFCEGMRHLHHYVKFPTTELELNQEKTRFMNTFDLAFPGIIGAIDCTHVSIIAPPADDQFAPGVVFLNRKGYHSLNVQVIVNAELKILNINGRYPGSVHDAAIWQTSIIRPHLQQLYEGGIRNCWLLGDSGYPLQPWLMTPFGGNNLTQSQQQYNIAHRSVRNVIERFNGVWKGRFRCLGRLRVLYYKPEVATTIVNACAILHNLCVARGDHGEEYIEANDDEDNDNENPRNIDDGLQNINYRNQGGAVRDRIVQDYF